MQISTEFWATTAQVIPALLLAFVLTQRPEQDRKKVSPRPFRMIYSAIVLLSIALGVTAEFLALDGLLGGGGRGTARVVILAIGVLAFWAVLAVAVWSGVRFFPDDDAGMDGLRLHVGAVLIGQLVFSLVVAVLPLAAAIWLAIRT
ncbi:hypothetical protein [Amycolatopsis sp. NPDC051071]|uniref:hypothetical protein n=1 Tax=Amycolatopsis sp. NPDC051071 TaxID=3154637 RepID=UPI003446176A